MRYYLDTEFDGHNGPLLSLALVPEAGPSIHLRTGIRAMDLWVIRNVEPLMDHHDADVFGTVKEPNMLGERVREFIGYDASPVIIVADSPVDIGRFCQVISTGRDGGWESYEADISFEVHNVDCYPTTLFGAVQHNAWWDAMALREKLQSPPDISAREALSKARGGG